MTISNVFKNRSFLWILLAFFTLHIACKGDTTPTPDEPTPTIQLDVTNATLTVGDQLDITPTFTPVVTNPSDYKWKVDNIEAVELTVNQNHSVSILAKSAGEAKVSISSPLGELLASCIVTVVDETIPDDGIVKILAIGNSFSEDAIEHYLHGLAKAAGKEVVIGNLYIGGAALSLHVQNAVNNTASYAYRKIDQEGNKTNTPNTSISTALEDDDWDYISFQQASPNSGQYDTFVSPLPALYNYVKARATNPAVKYILHQTWAYQQSSTHSGFANYNKDQETMYQGIVAAYTQAKSLINAHLVVPAGTAIQNGRTSVVGDNFCRDGYHLDLNIGRYTASCTWFEAIFGESVIGNPYKPISLTDYEKEIAQNAAHMAVLKPNEVTVMTEYQSGGSGILDKPVLINFGTNAVPSSWNTLAGSTAAARISNLKDNQGNYTGTALSVVEPFNARNTNGPKETTVIGFDMPEGVTSDSFYGNSKAVFNNKKVSQSVIKFEGLDKTKKYDFCFFGSRIDAKVSESRQTKYTVKGGNESSVLLETMNNTSSSACVNAIQPDSDGNITITITAGESNANAYGFYYLNAMRIALAD